jgi:transposase
LPSNLPINEQSFRRIEVLTGTARRRRWSAAEKAAIVAESFAPGAVTSDIALRHGVHRNQLYGWRRELRLATGANATLAVPEFVPVVAEGHVAVAPAAIEIEIPGAVLRVAPGVDLAFLGRLIRVLKMTR